MFRWFESLIPVFPPVDSRMPPRNVAAFYLYYLRPVWPVLLATLVAGLLLALVEVAMFDATLASSRASGAPLGARSAPPATKAPARSFRTALTLRRSSSRGRSSGLRCTAFQKS